MHKNWQNASCIIKDNYSFELGVLGIREWFAQDVIFWQTCGPTLQWSFPNNELLRRYSYLIYTVYSWMLFLSPPAPNQSQIYITQIYI